ncbi:hypothetical protein ABEW60_06525 [Paenibacillus jamilae]|uniref:hypothetical protein n=1 Tax=Paenibacillus TaxID=44249 RepID=UPI00046FF286|nr:hypothetical protein [Paenibacillus polymyxa]
MKKNKLIATALSLSLLGAVVAPSAIFASSNVNDSFQEQTQSQIPTLQHLDTATLQKNLEAAQGLEKYIKPGADGLLYIDEAGKDVVSKEAYEYIASGVQIINESLKSGQTKLDVENQTIVPSGQAPIQTQNEITPNASSNTYWWGVAITMSQSETKQLSYVLKQQSKGYLTVSGLAAAIGGIMGPNPIPWGASAAAALVSLGTDLVASSLDNYNGSRGTTLNLHWLPAAYYTVNSN